MFKLKDFLLFLMLVLFMASCSSIRLYNVPITKIEGFKGRSYSNNITYRSDQIFKSRRMIEFLNILNEGTYEDLEVAGYGEKEATKKGGLMTPLSWAIYAENKSTFKWLIEHNADVYKQFTYYPVPIILVINKLEDPEYIEIVLNKGLKHDYYDAHLNNLYLNAMAYGTEEVARLWIQYTDNLYKTNRIGKNAFTLACASSKYIVAGMLLDLGMDPFPENDSTNNVCLLNLYSTRGYTDIDKWEEYFTFYERMLTLEYQKNQHIGIEHE